MVTFLLPTEQTKIVVKGGTSFFCSIELDLPEDVREQITMAQLSEACGIFLIGFYLPPVIGTTFDHEGFVWRVTGIHESVKKYKTRGNRKFPNVICEYLGKLDDSPEDFS